MAKVIKFKTYTDNAVEFLENVKQQIIEEDIDNVMIACKCKDGTVLTGYTNNLDHRNQDGIKFTYSNGYNK